jgi:hypothetical protein
LSAPTLQDAELEPLGVLAGSSNNALLCRARTPGAPEMLVVYKPGRGERPLWDFPPGLYKREIAAYRVCAAAGWDLVPETVLRDGPYGEGAVQRFVRHDPDQHYLTSMPERADDFRLVAALDVAMNNADRKSGHCLIEEGTGLLRIVDHGLCFHIEPKLRTVIWEFMDEPLSTEAAAGLQRLLDTPPDLTGLLDPAEIELVSARARSLLQAGRYPRPPEDRPAVPWPLV